MEISANQVKEFIDSPIHEAYLERIEMLIHQALICLEDEKLEYNGRDYDKFRGGINSYRSIQDFFTDLYIQLKERI